MAVMTYREALNLALREEMRRDPRVFVIGEEVGLYDGAYKVTQGLLKEFGEQRIVDTPIAESGFTGIGVGAAMLGLRPVVEMMTFNFSILALDQIVNSAAKMLYMSGGQYNIPLVVRGPGGPAAQLAAQHSQSMETYFYHVPGLKVVRPSTPADAKGLLKSAIRDDNPVIFIEAETLYAVKGEVPEDPDFTIPLGKAIVRREGTDITVVAYMGMMYRALEVAEDLAKDGISIEIVDPRTLRPMDTETIIGSVRKTHRAVVLEAGAGFAGMGSEISAFITENAFDDLDAPGGARHRRECAHAVRAQPRAVEDAVQGQDRRGHSQGVRGMITKVLMPKLSEAMETGKVIQWLKKEGDSIKGGDVIAEIETDKANVEVEAFGSGVLRKILVGPGGTVPVGELIGVIADPADDVSGLAAAPSKPDGPAAPAAAAAPSAPAPAASPPAPAPESPAAAVPTMEAYRSTPATAAVVPVTPAPAAVAARAPGERVKASPLARKIAAQSGVDLHLVQGSGPGGRIVRRDVETASAQGPAAAPASAASPATAAGDPPSRFPRGRTRSSRTWRSRPCAPSSPSGCRCRRRRSRTSTSPTEVAMDRAMALRAELNGLEGQPKISVTIS
jgi:pyruvate dehydrogenase E1 component beta subunit